MPIILKPNGKCLNNIFKTSCQLLPPPLSSVSSCRRVSLSGTSIRSAFSKPSTDSGPDGPRPTGAGTPVMTVGIILMGFPQNWWE